MRLSASNIGWDKKYNDIVYEELHKYGFKAIEIAPTKLIEENPYVAVDEALSITNNIKQKYGLEVSSMQSIWYGKQGNIFNKKEAEELYQYTCLAINFASGIKCNNIVFGCPKNRIKPESASEDEVIDFFKALGEYALSKGTVFSMEANPKIYATNFINTTKEAFEFAKKVNSDGFKVNVDFGTIIENNENLKILEDNFELINHIHISEPNLIKIKRREKHQELFEILKRNNYSNYVSIEMKQTDNLQDLLDTIKYVKEIFGD